MSLHLGDCRDILPTLDAGSVHCVVTSPPYWQQRSYGIVGELGSEREPGAYVDALVEIGRLLRRVLVDYGSLWLNIGDVYAASGKGGGGSLNRRAWAGIIERKGWRSPPPGYKRKDLTLVAFQVADALRRDGWYLRSTIIWSKPTASEPPREDRPASSHEYLFQFTLGERYYVSRGLGSWWGRTVWDITSDGSAHHPAVMPEELAARCILAGCPEGGVVLDPFAGSGTVGRVAERLSRRSVLIELNPEYVELAERRTAQAGLGLAV